MNNTSKIVGHNGQPVAVKIGVRLQPIKQATKEVKAPTINLPHWVEGGNGDAIIENTGD